MSERLWGERESEYAKKETSDPKELVAGFLSSSLFSDGLDDFQGQEVVGFEEYRRRVCERAIDEIGEDEVLEAFLNTLNARMLFLGYVGSQQGFVFDEAVLPPEVINAYSSYRYVVQRMKAFLAKDVREDLDEKRSREHYRLAEVLFEGGFVPSVQMGRAVARLMLMSDAPDLDSMGQFRSDELRKYRFIE